jgi:hypothetical protein
MFANLFNQMNETVEHWLTVTRDAFGKPTGHTVTEHLAHVTRTPGSVLPEASKDEAPASAATIWLVDHPRAVAIGDTFSFGDGEALTVARVERRELSGHTIHKVYLQNV